MKLDAPEFYEDLVKQSVETGISLPYKSVLKLCQKYGKPIAAKEIDERIADLTWKTKPRFTSTLARTNLSQQSFIAEGKENTYQIMFKGQPVTDVA